MKIKGIILLVIFLIYSNCYNQTIQLKKHSRIILSSKVKWEKLLRDKLSISITGQKDKDIVIKQIGTKGKTIYLYDQNQNNLVFTKQFLYNIIINNLPSGTEYLINKYSKSGKYLETKKYNTDKFILSVYGNIYSNNLFIFFLDDLELEKGIMKVSLYNFTTQKTMIKLKDIVDKFQGRLYLPLLMIFQKNIYISFENNYRIMKYSNTGKYLKEFTNIEFKKRPYTKYEINKLNPIVAAHKVPGVDFPPILKKINITLYSRLIVTRAIRPAADTLFFDTFSLKGDFLKSNLILFDNENYILDVLPFKDSYFVLIYNKRKDQYYLDSYSLNK